MKINDMTVTTAESRISDADTARELMLQTKDKILHNSEQAIFAQTRLDPEVVKSLLV